VKRSTRVFFWARVSCSWLALRSAVRAEMLLPFLKIKKLRTFRGTKKWIWREARSKDTRTQEKACGRFFAHSFRARANVTLSRRSPDAALLLLPSSAPP
jgi:hypothetical protein